MHTKSLLKIWLLSPNFEKFTYICKPEELPITALQTPDCDWSLFWFVEVNFSRYSNQISGMTLFAFTSDQNNYILYADTTVNYNDARGFLSWINQLTPINTAVNHRVVSNREFIWTKKFCTQLFGMKFHRGGNKC